MPASSFFQRSRLAVIVLLLMAIPVACSAPSFLDFSRPAPVATAQTVIVVATPTAPPITSGVDGLEQQRIAVYRRAAPAVVNITTQVLRTSFFWGDVPEEGSGSGFVWDTRGHIVTNYHVVEGAQSIEVAFGGDVTVPAKVVGTDPMNDLAVLRVDALPEGAQPLEHGSSAGLQVGQTAIAIGNPFGQFQRTLTVGVVSALDRTIESENSVLRGVIQTDAAINRGNSGGPLLDSSGRLIGVNTAIYSPSGTSAGVGLAIPADRVVKVVPVLIEKGRYPHPWLGIEGLGYEIGPALAQALDLPVQSGLLVAQLYRNSPADRAGLRSAQREAIVGNRRVRVGGDIVTAIDGRSLATWSELSRYLDENSQVGQTVTLTVIRNGQQISLTATIADTPDGLTS